MQIEVVKKSVERFRQVVDFGPVLPDDVRVTSAILSVRDAATGEASDVIDGGPCEMAEDGRSVRFVVKGGKPGSEHAAEIVCTLSDGQVVVQDVAVRVESGGKVRRRDGNTVERETETIAKDDRARGYAGEYAQSHAGVGVQARQARAYGRDERDKRVFLPKPAGLPVAKCPECADGGEPAEVDMNDIALGKGTLKRGKMLRAANLLQGGVSPAGGDVTPIRVARLDVDEAKRVGRKYAVVPGGGNHRMAHLMISRRKGTIPVVIVGAKVAKYDPDQPRDDAGRWGDGGGGSSESKASPEYKKERWTSKVAIETRYPKIKTGDKVDDRVVSEKISNTDSIGAAMDDYESLSGIREVSMKDFTITPGYSATERERVKALADQIRESGEIAPLIVVSEKEGPYILEGGHRLDALALLGAKSFPALVVMNRDPGNEEPVAKYDPDQPRDDAGRFGEVGAHVSGRPRKPRAQKKPKEPEKKKPEKEPEKSKNWGDKSPQEFSASVLDVANSLDARVFSEGPDKKKIFISSVWDKAKESGISRETFNQKLLHAHQTGLITLNRADIWPDSERDEVERSEIAHLNATFHVIRIEKSAVTKYDPDQPRDEAGRFGEGSGGSTGSAGHGSTTSRHATEDVLMRQGSKVSGEITDSQREALAAYARNDYLKVNEQLRSGQLSDKSKKQVDLIDEIMSVSATDSKTTSYRGLRGKTIDDFVVGKEFSDDGFVSASTDEKIATGHAHGGVVMVIDAGKGTRAIPMTSAVVYGDEDESFNVERELILDRGSKFNVTGKEKGKNGAPDRVFVTVLRKALAKYDPDQPRDDAGRFGEGSGGGRDTRKVPIRISIRSDKYSDDKISELDSKYGGHGIAWRIHPSGEDPGTALDVNRQDTWTATGEENRTTIGVSGSGSIRDLIDYGNKFGMTVERGDKLIAYRATVIGEGDDDPVLENRYKMKAIVHTFDAIDFLRDLEKPTRISKGADDQPRDDQGRWGEGGGASSAHAPESKPSEPADPLKWHAARAKAARKIKPAVAKADADAVEAAIRSDEDDEGHPISAFNRIVEKTGLPPARFDRAVNDLVSAGRIRASGHDGWASASPEDRTILVPNMAWKIGDGMNNRAAWVGAHVVRRTEKAARVRERVRAKRKARTEKRLTR